MMTRNLSSITILVAALVFTSCSRADEESPVEQEPPPSFEAVEDVRSQPVMLRLTHRQYENSVRDVFGDGVVVPARLEPDVRIETLVRGAREGSISVRGAEAYEQASYEIARQVLEEPELRDDLVDCEPAGEVDEACAKQVLEAVGRRLWRRPLTSDELARLVEVSTHAARTLESFDEGLVYGLSALLQSPKFLFRIEVGRDSEKNGRELTDYELATRLSYFLWNTTPDETLLAAAEAGELSDPEQLSAQVWRLLESERAREGVRTFFVDAYELDRLDEVTKAPEIFEHASEDLGPAAREETLRVVEHLVFEERADIRDLMTTRTTFVNPKLASVYNVRAPVREGFGRVELPEDGPRAGLLGHASVLSLYSHPVSSSATLRGRFVRSKLLCQTVPSPPAGVDTSIPEPSGTAPTLRDRLEEHLESPACAGCHTFMDPIGLALENFDGIGRYRATDNGSAIDASGEIDEVAFDDALGLAHAVREHPRFVPCFVERMYEHATAHELDREGRALVELLVERFALEGHDVLTLMHDVAVSPAFRRVAATEEHR